MITVSEWSDPTLPGITHKVVLLGEEVLWEVWNGDNCLGRQPGWLTGQDAAIVWAAEWRSEGRDTALAHSMSRRTP